MRLNLLLDGANECRSGYVNLDPLAPPDDPERTRGSIVDLSPVCEAAEATEILALDVVTYWPRKVAGEMIAHWVSRLAHGGKLTISLPDAEEVSRAFYMGQIDFETYSEFVHGAQQRGWDERKSGGTLEKLVAYLSGFGLKILAKRVVDYKALVTAERP